MERILQADRKERERIQWQKITSYEHYVERELGKFPGFRTLARMLHNYLVSVHSTICRMPTCSPEERFSVQIAITVTVSLCSMIQAWKR